MPIVEPAKKFGRLIVIERSYLSERELRLYYDRDARLPVRWVCLCSCGQKTITLGTHLRNGHTKSCGCLRSEKARDRQLKRREHAG